MRHLWIFMVIYVASQTKKEKSMNNSGKKWSNGQGQNGQN